jgi:hypothetical protein
MGFWRRETLLKHVMSVVWPVSHINNNSNNLGAWGSVVVKALRY